MNSSLLRNFILMALMVGSALVAPLLRATTSMADQRPPIDLENMVPRQFGEWRELTGMAMQLVNPEQQVTIDRIYSQTLSRIYVNRNGYRIMLSIAYGKDQSDALQIHKPEACYPAQGFQLNEIQRVTLKMPKRSVSATRLVTNMGQRYEPVTYWIVLGDEISRGGLDKKLKEMRYSLVDRTIPDGMLVRYSSIDKNKHHAFEIQAKFATSMIEAINPENRPRFAGIEGTN